MQVDILLIPEHVVQLELDAQAPTPSEAALLSQAANAQTVSENIDIRHKPIAHKRTAKYFISKILPNIKKCKKAVYLRRFYQH
ncbi:hypothetical protein V6x_51430 [Gimesia chilikensis]|uniref:Uncharacterized protein n=1 Tax=Gimesia chilikensis TaxID=2605989 RepID=A0A517WJH9_9PLAN|nr:hypothetical protein V6x_51430 [Gimesia chilikensis]